MNSALASFVKRHPVLFYYMLVFLISWGGGLLVLGPSGFVGIGIKPRTQLLMGVPVGILGPLTAGLVLTALLYGRPGLRRLGSELVKWRVGAAWYVFALLMGPAIITLALLILSAPPALLTAADKAGLLIPAIASGLVVAFFEEVGWTGFATPELRKRFGVLSTGLVMGVLWGLWHFPVFSASGRLSDPFSPLLFTALLLFTWLIPYRVLMVWLYDRTASVLLAILMHVPIVVASFALAPETPSNTFTAMSNVLVTIGLGLVAVLIFAIGRHRSTGSTERERRPVESSPVV